ncbi:hypothetical protein BDBG_00801 [Blastomyces gilchristii SLH14081]|uniref:Uncharacterized protein n=1 Tax=Blastomyces gilchristii (strain SLH14081) TaxID=559298 RepID=A0A179UB06_BLAGS|nr:uncharacterized protein BDBG_00801 [Blastomyces gilchristii SLH14081]OAT04191.1 hypothetical protein BDBG_00801 [Blastomyces gilchristii SLH14081]
MSAGRRSGSSGGPPNRPVIKCPECHKEVFECHWSMKVDCLKSKVGNSVLISSANAQSKLSQKEMETLSDEANLYAYNLYVVCTCTCTVHREYRRLIEHINGAKH